MFCSGNDCYGYLGTRHASANTHTSTVYESLMNGIRITESHSRLAGVATGYQRGIALVKCNFHKDYPVIFFIKIPLS